MHWLIAIGREVTVVACTDGEASHQRSTAVTRGELRVRRSEERAEALAILGISPDVRRLGLPDGALASHELALRAQLEDLAGAATTLVVPWEHDGHPDHRAAFRAGAAAAERCGAQVWQVPIWGKVHRRLPYRGRRAQLRLSAEAHGRKATAVAAFASQIEPVGPSPFDGPVVTRAELASLLDGVELILW